MFSSNCSTYLPITNTSNSTTDDPGSDAFATDFLWILGMVFAILSSLAVSFGTVLQKKAFVREATLAEDAKHRKRWGILLSATWLWGLLFMIMQIPFTVAALALAPQSLVNPLGAGCTIVLSLVLAVFILGEKMGRMEVLGSLLIIAGVILSTAANAGGARRLSACEIVNRYGAGEFLGMFVGLLLIIISGVMVVRNPDRIKSPNLLTIVIAFTAGGMGAVLNVFLKVVGEFLTGAIGDDDMSAKLVWSTVHPYYSLLVIIIMAFGMISFISQGLEHSVAVLFLPVYNCLFIILSSVLGGLFFQEFDTLGSTGLILFPLGISVIVMGILVSVMGSANLSPRDRLLHLKRDLVRGGKVGADKTEGVIVAAVLPVNDDVIVGEDYDNGIRMDKLKDNT
ncbi:hypothetical protein BASA81_000013 [Batrachochytrium salamandrivorans]|nr:hypothetical protein BASA81_000013 [Batrachochytrium salamandrivorans]